MFTFSYEFKMYANFPTFIPYTPVILYTSQDRRCWDQNQADVPANVATRTASLVSVPFDKSPMHNAMAA